MKLDHKGGLNVKELRLTDLANVTNGILEDTEPTQKVKRICIDSRKVMEGDLFVAIDGERFDGHDFVAEAYKKGCTAVLVHKETEDSQEKIPMIRVKDTLDALQQMAKYYVSLFDIPIVAVTGSTGKTSTKEMIAAVLSQKYNIIKNVGNYNNHIGLPLSVFNIEDEHGVAIFEMGMSALGEIDLLASIVKPDIGVITNIGLSHIENLGSQENILKAKMEITNYFDGKSKLIINYDDQYLRLVDESLSEFEIIKIGTDKNSDFTIYNHLNLGENGIEYDIKVQSASHHIRLNVPGEHNVYNASLALAVGQMLNVDINQAIKGLKEYSGYDMRLNILNASHEMKILNDVYNASPDSMKAALDTLVSIKGNRHIAILSNMLEMGSFAEKYHFEIGEYAVKNGVDIIIAVGDDAKNIAEGAKSHATNQSIYHFSSNEALIKKIGNILGPADIILVKGSRGMKMEMIVNHILER